MDYHLTTALSRLGRMSHGCPYLFFLDVHFRHKVGRPQTVLWMKADNVDLGNFLGFIFLKYFQFRIARMPSTHKLSKVNEDV